MRGKQVAQAVRVVETRNPRVAGAQTGSGWRRAAGAGARRSRCKAAAAAPLSKSRCCTVFAESPGRAGAGPEAGAPARRFGRASPCAKLDTVGKASAVRVSRTALPSRPPVTSRWRSSSSRRAKRAFTSASIHSEITCCNSLRRQAARSKRESWYDSSPTSLQERKKSSGGWFPRIAIPLANEAKERRSGGTIAPQYRTETVSAFCAGNQARRPISGNLHRGPPSGALRSTCRQQKQKSEETSAGATD